MLKSFPETQRWQRIGMNKILQVLVLVLLLVTTYTTPCNQALTSTIKVMLIAMA